MPAYTPRLSEIHEKYLRHRMDDDFDAAIINARQIVELMVAELMNAAGLQPSQAQNKNEENINILFQAGVISAETKANYHQIRMTGNRVTHNEKVSASEAERIFGLLETEFIKFQSDYTDDVISKAKKTQERTIPKAVNRYKTSNTYRLAGVIGIAAVIFVLVIFIFVGSSFFGFRQFHQGISQGIQDIFESMPEEPNYDAEREQHQEEYEQNKAEFEEQEEKFNDVFQNVMDSYEQSQDPDTKSPADIFDDFMDSDDSADSDSPSDSDIPTDSGNSADSDGTIAPPENLPEGWMNEAVAVWESLPSDNHRDLKTTTMSFGDSDTPSTARIWTIEEAFSTDESVVTVDNAGNVTAVGTGSAFVLLHSSTGSVDCYLYHVA